MQVKRILDAATVTRDTSVNRDDLQGEFTEQSGLTYFYSAKHAEAARQEMRAKRNLELVSAKLDSEYRQEARDSKEKVTEPVIANRIKSDDRYSEAFNVHADSALILNLAKGAMNAMANKRDMLIQLGASERQEIKGSLRLHEETPRTQMEAILKNRANSDG